MQIATRKEATMSAAMPSPNTFARAGRCQRETPAPPGPLASAYDHVGDEYGCYADGKGLDDPSVEASRFAHADTIVWQTLRETIDELRAAGVSTLRVLDAGCGPGTWIMRTAAYADRLGLGVEAIGFDIAQRQLEIARTKAESFGAGHANAPLEIEFLTHDLADPLPWSNAHFHIVLCIRERQRARVPNLEVQAIILT
jgi:SAM-dependent methyltransferase